MNNRILKYTVLFALVAALGGCNLLTDDPDVLINDRINNFESSLNSGAYSDLQKHFHPDMASYDAYQDSTIFTSGPLNSSNSPFVFGHANVNDISGSDNKTATGSFGNKYISANDETYTAVMKKDGDAWKILEMNITVSNSPYDIRTLR